MDKYQGYLILSFVEKMISINTKQGSRIITISHQWNLTWEKHEPNIDRGTVIWNAVLDNGIDCDVTEAVFVKLLKKVVCNLPLVMMTVNII